MQQYNIDRFTTNLVVGHELCLNIEVYMNEWLSPGSALRSRLYDAVEHSMWMRFHLLYCTGYRSYGC